MLDMLDIDGREQVRFKVNPISTFSSRIYKKPPVEKSSPLNFKGSPGKPTVKAEFVTADPHTPDRICFYLRSCRVPA